ncbi:ANTH-domain-containing protein [Rhizopogon vinicolor AM-OR11-026]|uniref:ANTH-domain-containing protein n=1 Tax=Rhizopogon vinicolor AM-OR11-026 TaxID=1314800 RepID=A0A1B7MRP0_9AGAM|nr:ANTH-domain-containing protein [Rhizopogon vinicolor AM-OR11-026]
MAGDLRQDFRNGGSTRTYVQFILAKLRVHRLRPEFTSLFDYEEYILLKGIHDPNEDDETISDLMGLQDQIESFQRIVFAHFRHSVSNECRISALAPLVKESWGIYRFITSMLRAMHRRTNDPEALEPLHQRFNLQHYNLRKFYDECSSLKYLTGLIDVPKLGLELPNLLDTGNDPDLSERPNTTAASPAPLPAAPSPDSLAVTEQARKLQDATEQKESSSHFDVDITNPFGITEEPHDNSYNNFFSSSHPTLPSASSDPTPRRRLWKVFFVPSLPRPLTNESVQLQERPKRRFFVRRARSTKSPLQAPATEPTQEGKVRAGGDRQCGEDVDIPNCSANITPGDAGVETTTSTFDDPSSPATFIHDPSPEVVEVCAARGFQRYVAFKRKHKTKTIKQKHKAKLPALTASAPATTTLPSGSSQAGITLRGQVHTSSQVTSERAGLSSQVAGGVTSDCNNDDSDSDSSIQGSWNKFLDKNTGAHSVVPYFGNACFTTLTFQLEAMSHLLDDDDTVISTAPTKADPNAE